MSSSFIHLHVYLYLLLMVMRFNSDKITGGASLVSRQCSSGGQCSIMQYHVDKHLNLAGSCCLVVIYFL